MRDKFSKILPYLIAIFAVEQMTLLKWWLDPYIGQPSPFLLFYIPIIISVWYGGIGPGLLSIVLAGLSVALFFLPEGNSTLMMLRTMRLGLFAGESIVLTWLCYMLQQAKGQVEVKLNEAQHVALEAKKSEERHRLLTSELPRYAIVLLDAEGRVETWNKGPAQLFQYLSREAVGENFSLFYPADDKENELPIHHLKMAGEEGMLEISGWRVRKDRSLVWVDSVLTALRDEAGRLLGFSLLMHDTTERRQADELLKQSERDFREMFERAQDGIVFLSADTETILKANLQACELYGYNQREITGLTWEALTKKTGRPPAKLRDRFEKNEPLQFETIHTRKNGADLYVEVSVADLHHQGVRSLFCVIRDVTARKRAERLIATQTAVTRILIATNNLSDASSRILEAICESLGWDMGALWIFDQYARRLRCARTWTSPAVKVTRFEAISRQRTFTPGEGFPGRIWANGAAAWVADITKDGNFRNTPVAAEDGLHGAFGFPILLGSETLGVIEIFSREVKLPEDEILDFVHSIGSQIGHFVERKRSEEILKESEEQFRAAFEKAPVGIAHLGADGRFHRINQKLCDILGYSRKELLDLSIKGVTHPEDLNNNLKNFQKVLTGEVLEYTSEGRYTMKDGTVIWANASLSLVRDQFGQVKYLIAVIEDINQRKTAEAGLLEWKRRFEAAHQALGLRR